jgi:hypothetical protein
VAVHFVLDEFLGDRDAGLLDESLGEEVASLLALREDRSAAHLILQALAQLGDGVELARQLGELVVGLGKLALLDGGEGDLDLGVLPLVLAAQQLRGEGVDSPAVRVSMASSVPASRLPAPTSYDTPLA